MLGNSGLKFGPNKRLQISQNYSVNAMIHHWF